MTKEVTLDYFKSKLDWKSNLQKELGENYEVLSPRLPNKENAQYADWKIWFERMIPFLADDVISIGHSLGALFLLKYLSENVLSKKIKAIFLIAPPFDEGAGCEPLGTFKLTSGLNLYKNQIGRISFFFSNDDLVVPPYHREKYQQSLPEARFNVFEDRRHFGQLEFPELIKEIKTNQ